MTLSLKDITAEESGREFGSVKELHEPGSEQEQCHGWYLSGAYHDTGGSHSSCADRGCQGVHVHGVWSEDGGEPVQLCQQLRRVWGRDEREVRGVICAFLLSTTMVPKFREETSA